MNALMNTLPGNKTSISRTGFTLVEVMVGMSLTSLVVVAALTLFIQSARQFQDGSEHITFVDEARRAEQQVANIIQNARAASVTAGNSSSLNIVQPNLTNSRLYFQPGDSPEESQLIFDANINVNGDEDVIATYVSEIANTPMFRIVSGSNNTTLVSFYVGLRPPTDGATAGVRKSYTGAIIHMAASPRNIVDFIQQ
jgi:prepilin-type N-terminal cleavage/methylation domain-containing protein